MSGAYEAVTRGVLVRVQPSYLANQSDPRTSQYAWAYTVDIENHGEETVQLLSRRWLITDATNRVEEVVGPGVVGEQPVLKPGDAFHYTSACPLKTPSGVMQGTYRMETEGGDLFDAVIPAFSLHLPEATRQMNWAGAGRRRPIGRFGLYSYAYTPSFQPASLAKPSKKARS